MTPARSGSPRDGVRVPPAQRGATMPEHESLSSRIDAEFAAVENKFKATQLERLREYRERRERLRQLDGVFQKLAEAWEPRLDTLLHKFGALVQVTPRLTPSSR